MTKTLEQQMELIDLFRASGWYDQLKVIPFGTYFGEKEIALSIWIDDITEKQFRLIKQVFGPLVYEKPKGGGSSQTAEGKMVLDPMNDLKVTVCVQSLDSCTKVEIDEDEGPTQSQIQQAIENLKDGTFTLTRCEPFQASEESVFCSVEGCATKTYGEALCANHLPKVEQPMSVEDSF